MTLGPLFFAAPWALATLLALPALYWILRAAPPPPRRTLFPPLVLLLGLKTEEESKQRAPPWLLLLRALACVLMIIGFARPSLTPQAAVGATGAGPALIVIDDGWTAAPFWPEAQSAALAAVAEADRSRRSVFLLFTAPKARPADSGEALSPADARSRITRHDPQPWRPDRTDAANRLPKIPARFAQIVWVSDGLDDPGAAPLAHALQARGPLIVRLPRTPARAIIGAGIGSDGLSIDIRRAPGAPTEGAATAETEAGRSLGSANFEFSGLETRARIDLPPEIAARAARARLIGETSAGAVRLLADGAGRPTVGLIDSNAQGQSLLSGLFYVERAIEPYASLRRGDIRTLITERVQALIMPDSSRLPPPDQAAIETWLDKGGLLIRFAGPRLANDSDALLPVRLRPGSRALGGALAWEKPQALAPFPAESPFAGLTADSDISVRRQVLADPTTEHEARVWARLEDGASIITAAAHGKGLIVLFHVTAGPDWSNLPLSGLYVNMLRRTLTFAGRAPGAAPETGADGPWKADRLLDGFGALRPATADAPTVSPEAMAARIPGPTSPPGFYSRPGGAASIDAARDDEKLAPIALPRGVQTSGLRSASSRSLGGLFLAAAFSLIALDLLIALFLAGRLPLPRRIAALSALAVLCLFHTAPAEAADQAMEATLKTRLAFVRTGEARLDRITEAGLANLGEVLRARSSVEPAAPMGVDPATDDLSPYPILYWAAPSQPTRLSDAAVANLDRYMRLGGLLFIDTRDSGAGRQGAGPAAIMLQGVDAPPLEPVTAENVLAKSFYLLQSFPGRNAVTHLWAESAGAAAARDGVAALMVGDGDWASAWAADSMGSSVGGASARLHELSLRFGVNLVMVALTGNYKSDQVHVPALLERMGERGQEPP